MYMYSQQFWAFAVCNVCCKSAVAASGPTTPFNRVFFYFLRLAFERCEHVYVDYAFTTFLI